MNFLTSYKHSKLLYAFCLGSRLLLLVVYWEHISFVFKDLEICTLLSYQECLEKLHLYTDIEVLQIQRRYDSKIQNFSWSVWY